MVLHGCHSLANMALFSLQPTHMLLLSPSAARTGLLLKIVAMATLTLSLLLTGDSLKFNLSWLDGCVCLMVDTCETEQMESLTLTASVPVYPIEPAWLRQTASPQPALALFFA